jgi:signal transduction histidine kinase/ligand-binding sensor domain-containing protein
MQHKILILFFISYLSTLTGFGQYHNFSLQPVKDQLGQTSGATFAIAEDDLGFMWFGTLNGLLRYDGYGFRQYKHDKDDPHSLSNNMVRTMIFDDNGYLWIGTQGGGVNRFDPQTGHFTHYRHNSLDPNSLGSDDVWSLAADGKGNMWVGTWGGGLSMIHMESGAVSRYLPDGIDDFLNEDGIRSLCVDNDKNLWVGMHSTGLVKIHLPTREYVKYVYDPRVRGALRSNAIYSIVKDPKGDVWLATFGGGLHLYNKSNDSFETFRHLPGHINTPSSDYMYHMMISRNGHFWIANEWSGIDVFEPDDYTFTHLEHDVCDENSLSSSRIRYLFEDSKGIIWAGSEVGVDKVMRMDNFKVFRHIPFDPNSLNVPLVRSIYKDSRGKIWIGSFDTYLAAYDPRKKEYIKSGRIIDRVWRDGVTSMTEDDNGNFWLGTSNGIYVFDPYQNLIHRFLYDSRTPTRLSDNTIQIIRKGNDGQIWVGTERGLNLYDPITRSWRNFLHDPQSPKSIGGDKIQPNALIIQDNGVVWAGTWAGGLNKYLPGKDEFVRYVHDPENPNSISNNEAIALCKTHDGILWIGTFGGGLNRFDPITETFSLYTIVDGLPSNIIFAIHDDGDGNLWISTDNGLSRFNMEREEFTNYDRSDGLPGIQFFWGSSFQSDDGELFFGSTEGMVSFYPQKIKVNETPPQVRLTDIKVQNQSLSFDQSVAYISRFDFEHDVANVLFEFTAMDFSNPLKNNFAYRLIGSTDEDWVQLGNRNFINFSNIPPGNYVLQIIASNKDGVWNDQGIKISLKIKTPYWQTAWFRVLVGLGILLVFTGFYRVRTQKVKQQRQHLETIVNQRTRELEEANMELKTTNDELYNQGMVLKNTLEELQSAQKQLIVTEKMASLGVLSAGVAHEINNPLNFIHGGAVALQEHLSTTHLGKDEDVDKILDIIFNGVKRATKIVSSLNHYSRNDDVRFAATNIHDVIDSSLLMIAGEIKGRIVVEKNYFSTNYELFCNEGRIHQVLLNILSNAVHAIERKGNIQIRTYLEEHFFVISVTDDGIGISDENLMRITDPFFTTKDPGKGTGLGLSISQRIIEEHKGILEFHSVKGEGTTVLVKIPAV